MKSTTTIQAIRRDTHWLYSFGILYYSPFSQVLIPQIASRLMNFLFVIYAYSLKNNNEFSSLMTIFDDDTKYD